MKRISKFLTIVSLLLMLGSLVTACQKSSTSTSTKSSGTEKSSIKSGPPVKLTWYFPMANQPGQDAVFAAANKIIKEKINATVDFKPIDFGDYDTKMNQIAASGQPFDVAWTSSWSFSYRQNAQKGAFYPISDAMLAKDAPTIKEAVKPEYLNTIKVAGKLYGIPNYTVAGNQQGFAVQKSLADKYHLDPSKIHDYKDLEPFLAEVKKNEPGIIPLGINGSMYDPEIYNYYEVEWGVYNANDPNHKIMPAYEMSQFKPYLNLMHSWYQKGYINQDAGTIQDQFSKNVGLGKYAAVWSVSIQPGAEQDIKGQFGGKDVVLVPLTKAYFQGIDATMQAVSATSQHPDKALQLINLVDSDPDLYNLLAYGIEGTDYTKVDATHVKVKTDAKFAANEGWVFGTPYKGGGYLAPGQVGLTEQNKQYNASLYVPPLATFNFDDSSVKTEIANVSNVDSKFNQRLFTGVMDPTTGLKQYEDAMKAAGVDKVIQAEQKQVDAWASKNGK